MNERRPPDPIQAQEAPRAAGTGEAPEMACPICLATGPHPLILRHRDPFSGREYSLLGCPSCGASYADPMENPGPAWYAGAASAWTPGKKPPVPPWRLQAVRLARKARPGARRLLEIGCSDGDFLLAARESGFEAQGVDFDAAAAERARAAGLQVATASFEDFAAASPGGFDVIAFFQVLEHLADPRAFLARAGALLAPGGLLIFDLPDAGRPLASGSGLIDLPPHHLTRWRAGTVRRFLSDGGFEPLSLVSLASYGLLSDSLRSWAACRLGSMKRRLAPPSRGAGGGGAAAAPAASPSASFRLFDAFWRGLAAPLLSPFLAAWLAVLKVSGRGFYLACVAARRGGL